MSQTEQSAEKLIGFVGLGSMGQPMARRLLVAGWRIVGFDLAGTEQRLPEGGTPAASVHEVAAAVETMLLSLPDGAAVDGVVREIVDSKECRTSVVIDTSTIGIEAAHKAAATLAASNIGYIDAPVSGGVSGAISGSLAMMIATDAAAFDRHRTMLGEIAKNCFHVGDAVGQGQAMKLLNNFLSGTAMTATAEAISFGVDQGLDMAVMLDVLNASSGQNTATSDKFLRRVLTGTYDAGFATRLIAKDINLYEQCVAEGGAKSMVGTVVGNLWQQADTAMPGSDFTRIYDYVRDSRRSR